MGRQAIAIVPLYLIVLSTLSDVHSLQLPGLLLNFPKSDVHVVEPMKDQVRWVYLPQWI